MKTITMLLVAVVATALSQDPVPFPPPPPDVTFTAELAQKGEPGSPLVISGTVYRGDGTTPYAGLVLFFYQADNDGLYNKTDNAYWKPRLRGWVRTDERGRYVIRTIKPASYPRSRQAAHIHVTVRTSGSGARWLDDFLFSDDPFLSPSDRELPRVQGRRSHVLELSRNQDGILVGERDLVVEN